ncbi:MAG: sortase [Anaerolineae bacterium]|nr:sortase [Anaerolineae bacterium]
MILALLQLAGLLVILSACGDIIRVVPADTPTPAATATPQIGATAEASSDLPRRIIAESINLDAPVVEMGWQVSQQGDQFISEWDMPENEAGWHRNSALPGQGSNVVISGHNASTGGHVFAALDDLQLGDEIKLETDQAEMTTYRVVEKNIIRTFAASTEAEQYLLDVTQPTEREQLTLITCWPSWTNTHRLIVIAVPAPESPPIP